MKRSDVIEVISTVSVVVGLVFVGLQLHQNTTVQRITATQVLSAAYSDALEVISYEPKRHVCTSSASTALPTWTMRSGCDSSRCGSGYSGQPSSFSITRRETWWSLRFGRALNVS